MIKGGIFGEWYNSKRWYQDWRFNLWNKRKTSNARFRNIEGQMTRQRILDLISFESVNKTNIKLSIINWFILRSLVRNKT